MKKFLLIVVLFASLLLVGCAGNTTSSGGNEPAVVNFSTFQVQEAYATSDNSFNKTNLFFREIFQSPQKISFSFSDQNTCGKSLVANKVEFGEFGAYYYERDVVYNLDDCPENDLELHFAFFANGEHGEFLVQGNKNSRLWNTQIIKK